MQYCSKQAQLSEKKISYEGLGSDWIVEFLNGSIVEILVAEWLSKKMLVIMSSKEMPLIMLSVKAQKLLPGS